MSKKNFSRRKLLGWLGVSTAASLLENPYSLVYQNIIDGLLAKASAAGTNPRRYLYIQFAGAPARWTFDLFLTPYSTQGFQSNGNIGTRYVAQNGQYTDVEYATVLKNGIQVPWLWQFDVPKSTGGNRPMTDLLKNLVVLQGISTTNPGHPGSQLLHFRPTGSTQSMGALSADLSSTPIPAVNISNSNFVFKSKAGKSAVSLASGGNILKNLLNPFIGVTSATYNSQKQILDNSIQRALGSIESLALQGHEGAATIIDNRKGAENLLRTGFGDLDTIWPQLRTKYSDLITRAIDPTQRLAGINDLPIGTTGSRDGAYSVESGVVVSTPDLRDLISPTSSIQIMAEHFAVAEYVLLNNLSSSVSISPRQLILNAANAGVNAFNFDEHFAGKMTTLYLNSMYNRAFAACLLELIDQLQAGQIFNETVIDVGGEFNRSGRTDGFGSDHGWQGKSVALYSGAIQGPLILGNLRNDTDRNHQGTWGYGGVVSQLGTQLGLNHMAATIAYLLRTPSPITSAQSLVTTQNGVIVPLIEKTKIV